MLHLAQRSEFKAFRMQKDLHIETPVSLLIGRNGAGKSRIFEAIKGGSIALSLNQHPIDPTRHIAIFVSPQFRPSLVTDYDGVKQEQSKIEGLRAFTARRDFFDKALDPSSVPGNHTQAMPYTRLHPMVAAIAAKLLKKPSELTEEEFLFYYEDSAGISVGSFNVAGTFNRYVKRLQDNSYNRHKREKGIEVPAYSDDEFIKMFGSAPWISLNNIIDSVFEGEYHFAHPDTNSYTADHSTPLLDRNGRHVAITDLSGGEKTLMWLTLSIFSTQYMNEELLDTPKVLLLDEPDAFLHPKMVVKMYDMLDEFHKIFGTWSIVITHSPTTAALAPAEGIFSVSSNNVEKINRDTAISQLLDGVPQISIDPENRRQVAVESYYDSLTFQTIFDWLKPRSEVIDPKISVTFFASGGKIPREYLEQKVRQVLEIEDSSKISAFTEAVNGGGNCSQVYGLVDSLASNGVTLTKGLVDWDRKNHSTTHVVVLAEGFAYAIENVLLDPMAVMLLLHLSEPLLFPIKLFCGSDHTQHEWLSDQILVQNSFDYYIQKVLDVENERDAEIQYRSGICALTDKRYLEYQGHDMESKVIAAFPALKGAIKSRLGYLKFAVVARAMLAGSGGMLLPVVIENDLARLQA